jgi:hypothetical protein
LIVSRLLPFFSEYVGLLYRMHPDLPEEGCGLVEAGGSLAEIAVEALGSGRGHDRRGL